MIQVSDKNPKIFKKLVLFLGLLGVVFYPIFIKPLMNPEPYREVQSETRKYIKREDIQPGNMNIWSNPFLKKNKKEEQ